MSRGPRYRRDCPSILEGCPATVVAEGKDGERRVYHFKLRRGQVYTTIAGVLRAGDVLGKPWGYTIETRLGRITVARPTTADLMEAFYERKTQVVYPKDSGLIALLVDARPGAVIFESGTGSGFLTTVLASHVCPGGKVVSVEARKDNLEAARRNLCLAGLISCVELRLGDAGSEDVYRPGESFTGAVLDLPDPWRALERLHHHLPGGAPAVAFLPTYNQVEKLAAWTWETRLYTLQAVYETLLRELEVAPGAVRPSPRGPGFTGFIVLLRRAVPPRAREPWAPQGTSPQG